MGTGVIETEELFSFELDMGSGESAMPAERLEDTIYNCLDFCLLNGRTPHFYLGGEDPIRHPALWPVLELLREEDVSFSLLSEPEKTEFEQKRRPVSEGNRMEIACDGMTRQGNTIIGNIFEDRLADLWVVSGCGR